ncbi:MAG: hypothetical protein IKP45_07700 [Bacteroidales bacterium]|nr:hypothetical protein [Bacteroidales bacterium]
MEMLIISPYTKLVGKIDTLELLLNNMQDVQQEQFASMDSICDITEQLANRQSVLYSQMDSIQTHLHLISEYGVGYSDVVSHITIPLIIALVAFAFPFLFMVISHINNKYESEQIVSLFSSECSYKYFFRGAIISAIYLVLMGVLSLCPMDTGYKWLMIVMNWTSILLAGFYSIVIFFFVRTCIVYNTPQKLIDRIEANFKSGNKEAKSFLNRMLKMEKRNDKVKSDGKRDFYDQKIRIGKSCAYYGIEVIRVKQLVELCKYAFRKQDNSLFLIILQKIDKMPHPDANYEYYKSVFFEDLIESYQFSPSNVKIEESLIRYWFLSFKKSEFPDAGHIYRMFGKMVSSVIYGRIGLFEKYIQNASFGYGFVNELQYVSYVRGMSADEQKKVNEKKLDFWSELCEMHYLALAHLFSNGHYDAVKIVLSGRNTGYGRLFPNSGTDILKMYARCKEKQLPDGSFSYWFQKEVVGENTDSEMLEKLTSFMLLVCSEPSYQSLNLISEARFKLICDAKNVMVDYAKVWSNSTELYGLFPQIVNKDFKSLYEDYVNLFHKAEQINIDLNGEKTLLKIVSDLMMMFLKKTIIKQEDDIYNTAVPENMKEKVQIIFRNILYGNRAHIEDGLIGSCNNEKTEKIPMGELHLMTYKQALLGEDSLYTHNVFKNMLTLFKSRYQFMVYSALRKMQIEEKSIRNDEFEEFFVKLVDKDGGDYIIIDSGVHLDSFYKMDVLKDGRKFTNHQTYKGAYYKRIDFDSLRYLRDLSELKQFKNTLIILKKEDLPTLDSVPNFDTPVVELTNESEREKGIAAVSMTVNPNMEARFNKNIEVIKLNFKTKTSF